MDGEVGSRVVKFEPTGPALGPKSGPAWPKRELLGSEGTVEQPDAIGIYVPPGLMPGSLMNAGLDAGSVQRGTGSVLFCAGLRWCRFGAGPGFRENLDTSSRQLQAEMVRAREELQAPMEEVHRLQA